MRAERRREYVLHGPFCGSPWRRGAGSRAVSPAPPLPASADIRMSGDANPLRPGRKMGEHPGARARRPNNLSAGGMETGNQWNDWDLDAAAHASSDPSHIFTSRRSRTNNTPTATVTAAMTIGYH